MNKWWVHNPESVPENEMHEVLWDFEIQTDQLISTRQSNRIIIHERNKICCIEGLVVLVDHRVKVRENEKRDEYLDLARGQKTMEHESDGDTDCN